MMISKPRSSKLFTSAAASTGVAILLLGASVRAEEQSYFVGDVWGVSQSLPEGEGANPAEDQAYCMLSTQTWPHKGLNLLYVLKGIQQIDPFLQIYSENWELPVGKKTRVELSTVGGVLGYDLTAGSEHYLTGPIDRSVVGEEQAFALAGALAYMLNPQFKGMSMTAKFAGSEPEWPVPAMQPLEKYQVKTALDKCLQDLRALAADLFSKPGTNGKTSPFAE